MQKLYIYLVQSNEDLKIYGAFTALGKAERCVKRETQQKMSKSKNKSKKYWSMMYAIKKIQFNPDYE